MVVVAFGRLAFVLGLVALGFAFFRRDKGARANSIVLSTAIVLGTVHYILPLSRLEEDGAGVVSFALTLLVLWQLARAQGK